MVKLLFDMFQTGGLCFAEETDIVDTPSYIIDYDGQVS